MKQNSSNKPPNPVDDQIVNYDLQNDVQATPSPNTKKNSYGQALKSSAIIGGSSIINIAIGIVRTKCMALILGPSGVGLMGVYGSILDLTQSVAGMGVNGSGVRQIAEAVGTRDSKRIAKTAMVLRRTAIFLGLLGAAFLFGFSTQISLFTFGGDQHANGVALLSIAVFLNLVSAGQGALIQGMRQIYFLAKMGILGTIFSTIIGIVTIYYIGEDGVALSLVLTAAMTLITSGWYSRKIKIQKHSIETSELAFEQTALLKLGFAFMASGLMMTGTAYIVRLIIIRDIGFDAAGLYQSAWALGGLYIGLILQAMGTDFYPRLTAVANQNDECNRIVNEQTHISLLLATPGIIATLTLAPLVIELFYSAKFQGGVELLRWLCLGMALRVVSWPMGFIIMAKGSQKFLIISEMAWASTYLMLTIICVKYFNLNGVGIAFFGSYVSHVLINFLIVRKLSKFYLSKANLQLCFLNLAILSVVFISYYALTFTAAMVVGCIAMFLLSYYSIQEILSLVSLEKVPSFIIKLLRIVGFMTAYSSNNKNPLNNISSNNFSVTNTGLLKTKRLIVAFIACTVLIIFFQFAWEEAISNKPGLIDFYQMIGSMFKNIPDYP